MNCLLLDDEEYVNSVTELIPMWITEGREELSADRCVWDWIKYNIRVHAIHHSKRKAKQRKAVGTNPSDYNATLLDAAQKQLESFYEEKTKGIIGRPCVRWHEQGEKSTKYFLNLEKRNRVKKHIQKLHISGVTKTDPSYKYLINILKEVEQFYCDLYKTNNNLTDIEFKSDSFLNDLNIPTLYYRKNKTSFGIIRKFV